MTSSDGEIIWRFQHFMNWFWQYFGKIKKGGNYWIGEILRGRILIKEIQEFWSAHPMVWRILFSRIPNIFHQICFLFWSHPNGFMNSIQKITKYITNNFLSKNEIITSRKFSIRENKIREIISWAEQFLTHCISFNR